MNLKRVGKGVCPRLIWEARAFLLGDRTMACPINLTFRVTDGDYQYTGEWGDCLKVIKYSRDWLIMAVKELPPEDEVDFIKTLRGISFVTVTFGNVAGINRKTAEWLNDLRLLTKKDMPEITMTNASNEEGL